MADDLDAEMDTWADDAQFHRSGRSVVIGKEAIRSVVADDIEQYDWSFTYSSEDVGAAGDLGYYLGTYMLTRTDQSGEAGTFYGSTMMILRRQADGTWKITRYMFNTRPGAEE